MRKQLVCLVLAAGALTMSACASAPGGGAAGLTDLVKAANDLDPGCYKSVHVTATPMMLFGWAVPVFGGTYDKVCNPDKAAPKRALQAGQILPATPTP